MVTAQECSACLASDQHKRDHEDFYNNIQSPDRGRYGAKGSGVEVEVEVEVVVVVVIKALRS